MTQAIIYRRFSTDEQESGSSDTLARQSERCEAFAASRGWTVVETLTDKGRSAYKGEHLQPDAALGSLVARVKRGEIARGTVLVAERLDRLSRRPVDETMAWIHGLTIAGIEIALADTAEIFRPGDMASFLTTAIRASLGHEESRKKSDMTLASRERLFRAAQRREGAWTNFAGKSPSWLHRTSAADGWVIIEDRAVVVRDIFEMTATGLGPVAISQRLNAARIATFAKPTVYQYREGSWGASAVRQLIASPAVEGDLVCRSGPFAGRTLHGFYPRIVDADLVKRARDISAGRRKVKGESSGAIGANLFAAVSRCEACGRKAFSYSTLKKGWSYTYLRCEAAGEGRCQNTGGYSYQAFESTALDLILDLALDDRFFSAGDDLRSARIKLAELNKSISDATARRARLLTMFAAGDDDDQLAEMIKAAKIEIDHLTTQRADAQADYDRASGRVSSVEHLKRVTDIREAAASDDFAIRTAARTKLRQALASVVQTVEIGRHGDEKLFTVILRGGVMAMRIDTKGCVVRTLSEAAGRPLWSYLPAAQQEALAPLISRIEKLAA